jgi:hypothetical protein
MKPEDNPNSNPTEAEKPKRKILQTVVTCIFIGIVVLWIAGAIATESTDGPSFLNNPAYTDENGPLNKLGYDLSHPLDFIKNLQNNPVEPDIIVPSTYTEIIDQTALDHATGDDGQPIFPSTITAAETVFQATSNGIIFSISDLSSLLVSAVKPFDESTFTSDVSLLFPIKNPGDQKITVDETAHCCGGLIDNMTEYGLIIDWEKILTIPDQGSEIIMPVNAEVYRIIPSKPPNGSETYSIDTALICFTGPDGTNYELLICEEVNNGSKLAFSSDSILPTLADEPEIGDDYTPFSSTTELEGKILPAGTPILKTINNNTEIGFYLRCNKKNEQPDFNFISSQGKVIYLP